MSTMNILQYESKIWATADLMRGCGIKESEWPSFMMPFFALAMIESRLLRMKEGLPAEIARKGYNHFIFEKNQSLVDICKNDKSFEIDFESYLKGFDSETRDLLGVEASEGEKFLDIKGVIAKLKSKKVLFDYAKLWSEIDLKPFNNSEITTLEEHIKRKWADISAETAGEQYTPDDVIALIYERDIKADKTNRFQFLPSISDGQLLFMQHLISKLDATGMGVVVHNGSTLFSGDAGSAESNIRKWMLDSDIVEAVIQLPTDEFFNTGIYTYLWVLNKNKSIERQGKLMLINASEKFTPLKKSKGSKRKEVDEANRLDIVATLSAFKDNDYARVFDKEYFYFNKQSIMLINVDIHGNSYHTHLAIKKDKSGEEKRVKSTVLKPTLISQGDMEIKEFSIKLYDESKYDSLYLYYSNLLLNKVENKVENKDELLIISTEEGKYYYDKDQESIIKEVGNEKQLLGNGRVSFSIDYKIATKKEVARIEITAELSADYQKDYEIIPFNKDAVANTAAIQAFITRYINKPVEYLDNVVGVELNFNKIFYKPEVLRSVSDIMLEIHDLDNQLNALEAELAL